MDETIDLTGRKAKVRLRCAMNDGARILTGCSGLQTFWVPHVFLRSAQDFVPGKHVEITLRVLHDRTYNQFMSAEVHAAGEVDGHERPVPRSLFLTDEERSAEMARILET